MPTLAVVIPHHNRADLLRSVLTSVARQSRKPDIVVVVDNASTDDSEAVAREFGAQWIRIGTNAGFATAVNWGLTAVNTDWYAVLNNDVELEPEFLARLIAAADESGTDWATGKLLRASDHSVIDGTFDLISRSGLPWRAGSGFPASHFTERQTADLASFTAILLRASLIHEVGLLDATFESYLEDVDFSLRCAKAGKRGVYEPSAMGYHRGSATLGAWSERSTFLQARNQLLLIGRHYPAELRRRWRWPIAWGHFLWTLVAFRHGTGIACLKGKWQGLQLIGKSAPSDARPSGIPIADIILRSEGLLREIQGPPAKDWLWRNYFRLL